MSVSRNWILCDKALEIRARNELTKRSISHFKLTTVLETYHTAGLDDKYPASSFSTPLMMSREFIYVIDV